MKEQLFTDIQMFIFCSGSFIAGVIAGVLLLSSILNKDK